MTVSPGVPPISAPLLGFFRRIVRGYFRRSFHAVRVRGAEHFATATGPLIVYANHGSWWDPMVSFLLADQLMPERPHYAPMDERALERYRILRRLGVFGVELDSRRGAVEFLRRGGGALAAGGVVWVTPQGRFVDSRERPLVFKPGLAGLAARTASQLGTCTALPLAIEYTFWDERTPECLLQFGEPVTLAAGETAGSLDGRLSDALLRSMEELKEAAMRRDTSEFATLLEGSAGAGGFYSLGQRLRAMAARRQYQPEHGGVRR